MHYVSLTPVAWRRGVVEELQFCKYTSCWIWFNPIPVCCALYRMDTRLPWRGRSLRRDQQHHHHHHRTANNHQHQRQQHHHTNTPRSPPPHSCSVGHRCANWWWRRFNEYPQWRAHSQTSHCTNRNQKLYTHFSVSALGEHHISQSLGQCTPKWIHVIYCEHIVPERARNRIVQRAIERAAAWLWSSVGMVVRTVGVQRAQI